MSPGDDWVSTSMPYLAPRANGQGDAWSEEAAARGRRGTQRIVHAGEVPASEEVAGLLGVAAGEAVIVRRRVIELDGEPCELTDTYYPIHIAGGTGLAGVAKIPGGAVTLLARLGHVGVRVREDVTAGLPGTVEQQALRIGPDQPVLRLTRLTLDAGDRPLQADLMTRPPIDSACATNSGSGDRHRLRHAHSTSTSRVSTRIPHGTRQASTHTVQVSSPRAPGLIGTGSGTLDSIVAQSIPSASTMCVPKVTVPERTGEPPVLWKASVTCSHQRLSVGSRSGSPVVRRAGPAEGTLVGGGELVPAPVLAPGRPELVSSAGEGGRLPGVRTGAGGVVVRCQLP